MNISGPFIRRPVATTLMMAAFALAGVVAFRILPVAPLPQVDTPTISVTANMSGASPDTMAADVAAPLEKHLGQIADVSEMTSSSSLGSTRIILQFGLNRDINGAARDVQAAINAARADLPSSLRSNPSYHKINPADAPIIVLSLSSATRDTGQLYDVASNILQQALSQIKGVGEVDVGGSALPAVRVELKPEALFKYGIGLEDIRAALSSANANSPKGSFEPNNRHVQIYTNDQATKAADYRDLVVAWRNNAGVRLSDVAEVNDSVEDLRNAGLADGKPAVLVQAYRQPGANIIETVDLIKQALPQLEAALPGDVDLTLIIDRSTTIRASLTDTEMTLLISVLLVTLVVFVFLRDWRAALIPIVAVPVSIIGSFAAMWLDGASLDNLSLMALTISTGFVVDDAIVVLENITRHIEMGKSRLRAAFDGAREVGFTVMSINVSLIAVFVPILFMGGIVGRFFHEFAVTLSMAVMISLFVSLTATPMLCARFLPEHSESKQHGHFYRAFEAVFDSAQRGYQRSLRFLLNYGFYVMLSLVVTIGLNVYLFTISSYGLFPSEDTGLLIGGIQADQSISFQSMKTKLVQLQQIVNSDPAIAHVAGFTGGRQANSGFIFASLKPLSERKISADLVAQRLRPKLAEVAGARIFLQGAADFRTGGRQSNASYQFTLQSDDTKALYEWSPKLFAAMQGIDILTDVNSDRQQSGRGIDIAFDRDAVAKMGLKLSSIDNTLYDAFGQRQVSTIYSALNQYHVVMELAPRYWQSPDILNDMWISTSGSSASGTQSTNATAGSYSSSSTSTSAATVAADSARNQAINSIASTGKSSASSGSSVSTSKETMIPFSAVARFAPGLTPLAVNHQGFYAATTISFNLAPGHSLSEAQAAISDAIVRIGMPKTVQGSFAGTASTFSKQLSDEPMLILAALGAIYIVLGVLYESYVHPLTILSTLPSASVGAMLALNLFGQEFDIIAFIGVILLIGIVKKNAIMMIDFALAAQKTGLSPKEAIFEACIKRFRPIMMTTFAALLGAVPLAFGSGEGSELRHPLGITVVGGLIVSQILTLYTTPVVYLYLDRFSRFIARSWKRFYFGQADDQPSETRA
ncbi:efflux RND transporter permease subunit [Rhizobium sp.]|jgi:multidrug efflux pump|uniref:efflux RND transporter permease subunit n=1 Tax=Rhizobium sp. TaxID=391 RepID=UPI000E9BDE3A|nr:nodulation protein [Rhizobium sp.]